MRPLITLIAAGLLLGGCDPEPKDERAIQKAEQLAADERRQRERTEAELHDQTASTSFWRTLAALAFGIAGLALILGAILGSRARNDAEQ